MREIYVTGTEETFHIWSDPATLIPAFHICAIGPLMWKSSTRFSQICNWLSRIPRKSEMLRFKSSDMCEFSFTQGLFFLFKSLLYCSTSSHARILCAATPLGGLISEQKPYAAFRFALFMALLFPSELIHSSVLVVWGYLGWPILCLMSSETKISIFGHRMMMFIIGRDQW